jgi:methyl-accepting chemotaxis protein
MAFKRSISERSRSVRLWFAGLRARILLLIGLAGVALAVSGWVADQAIQGLAQNIVSLGERRIPITRDIGRAGQTFNSALRSSWTAVAIPPRLAKEMGLIDKAKMDWMTARATFNELSSLGLHPENQARLETLLSLVDEMTTALSEGWDLLEESDIKDHRLAVQESWTKNLIPMTEKGNGLFEQMQELMNRLNDESVQAALKTAVMMERVVLGVVLGAFVLMTMIGLIIASRIARTVTRVVQRLSSATSELNQASESLKGGAESLAMQSQSQASSLEETSASLEQISGMVESNSQQAESANQSAERVARSAEEAQSGLRELTSAIQVVEGGASRVAGLAKLIEEIGEKTEVIDEIVFQTRLLSFNASVEAERAGEHGRGFAVVAQEVGNLAQLSGRSAVEISAIVKRAVSEARTVSNETAAAIRKSLERSHKTTELIGATVNDAAQILKDASQIMRAGREQSTGLRQCSTAVESLNSITQENAATAQASAEASSQVRAQALALSEAVSQLNEVIEGSSSAAPMSASVASVAPKKQTADVIPLPPPHHRRGSHQRITQEAPIKPTNTGIAKAANGWDEL